MFKIDSIYENIRLHFNEEKHEYRDTFGDQYLSMTTILHNYQKKFDKEYWLKKKAKELGITQTALEKQWADITKEACDRGTNTHNQLEDGIKNVSMFYKAIKYVKRNDDTMITVADLNSIHNYVKPLDLQDFIECTNNKYPQIYQVFKFYIDRGYTIYSELGVFLPKLLISGMIDVLIIRDDHFVIGDWKTNRGGLVFESGYYKKDKHQNPNQLTNIWVKKNDKLLPPVSHLDDCNGNIYNLQLSGYAYCVEQMLNIPCAGLWLCHIDSDFILNEYGMPKRFPDGLYKVKKNPVEKTTFFKLKYLKDEIKSIVADRKSILQATYVQQNTLFK